MTRGPTWCPQLEQYRAGPQSCPAQAVSGARHGATDEATSRPDPARLLGFC